MKYNITLLVGLPGSGKTTFAKKILTENTFLIDDPNRDKTIWTQAIDSGKSDFIVCDPLLIMTKRETVESFLKRKFGDDVELVWMYFKNDPENAWNNHLRRNESDYRDISKKFFDHMVNSYVIPEDAKVIEVYNDLKLDN